MTPPPVAIEYPTLLKQPAPHLRAYRRETVIAEKFQVMIEKNIQNSRMKDYYDIWSLARTFDFEGQELAAAIAATFQQRQTPLPINLPLALSEEFSEHPVKQTQWRAFVQRGRLRTEACSLSEVVTFLQMFLLPPVTAITAGMDFEQQWTRARGWH